MIKRMKKVLSDLFYIIFSDERYLKIRFFLTFKRKLDLNNPKTFNEKIQWLKLYNRDEKYFNMVDKAEAKQIVKEKIGEEYTVKTLGVWDRFEDINFDYLPNKFVLKCTHDSASTYLIENKDNIDIKFLEKHFNFYLKRSHYKAAREWAYKGVKPRIIAEEYIESETALQDYKFFCFDGVPKIVYVSSNEHKGNATTDYFDIDFNHIDLKTLDSNAIEIPKKPKNYLEMIRIAKLLSKGIPHIRIDLYNINGKILFSEFTLYSNGGFCKFTPEKWDSILGEYIKLQNG